MTREEAVRRINRAAEENLTELDLAGLELEELPPEIGKCTQLETLVLGKFVMRVQAISIPYTVNYWL
jgi:Leucine-rich repeat (LRR) protein